MELYSLQGNTVELKPLMEDHLEALWKAAIEEKIWTFMATKIDSKAKLKTEIEKALLERDKHSQYPFIVQLKETGEIVGSTRYLDISEANKSVEIGWTWYHPSVWGSKVNTECKYLLLSHAFENWNFNRVYFKTDSRNIRSQNAIAKLGAVKEGVLRKDRIISDGYARDTVFFSILKEEWQTAKTNLEKKLTE